MAFAAASGAQGERLKEWLIGRLQPISNAEPSVLADYVLALLRHDRSDEELKTSCLDQLQDFLQSQTAPFVDDLFSHMSGQPSGSSSRKRALSPSSVSDARIVPPHFAKQARGVNGMPLNPTLFAGGPPPPMLNGRGYTPFQPMIGPAPIPSFDGGPRPYMPPPYMMNGGRGRGRGGFRGRGRGRGGWFGGEERSEGEGDVEMNGDFQGPGRVQGRRPKKMEICRDYHYKGYCARGEECQYLHDEPEAPALLAQEARPPRHNASAPSYPPPVTASPFSAGFPSPAGAASDASRGPSNSLKTVRDPNVLSVENIPPDCLSEDAVRGHFAKFGELAQVTLHPPTRRALVTFVDAADAQKAHSSPDTLFGNRFVKVFFHRKVVDEGQLKYVAPGLQAKTEQNGKANGSQDDVEMKTEDSAPPKTDGATTPAASTSPAGIPAPASADVSAERAEQLRLLREKALSLGIDISTLGSSSSSEAAPAPFPRGRGRGRPRASYRGSWTPPSRGRGAPAATGRALKLDNRPTTLSVTGVGDADAKNKLKAYFEQFGPIINFAPLANATSPGDVTVQFATRTIAEKALRHGTDLPDIGKVNLAWVANPATPASATTSKEGSAATPAASGGEAKPDGAAPPAADDVAFTDGADGGNDGEEEKRGAGDARDVYEDEDREEGWKR